MKIIKYFEQFTKSQFKEMINNKETYIIKKLKDNLFETTPYNRYKKALKYYDISNFIYEYHSYGIYIKPDLVFIDLIENINKSLEVEIPLNIDFSFSLDEENNNMVDFTEGIPSELRGFSLGYKLYKMIIEKNDFISTNKHSTYDAYHVWYSLMQDADLYCFTSLFESVVINKNITDIRLKGILDKLNKNLIFDDEIKEKIIDFYGSMDIYKQKN